MNHIKKAFTLTELIIVVAIIWILMMWLTVYLWWSWERAKLIEAQWCAISIWWKINNYVFYALTSKNLRLPDNTVVAPDYYYIQLTWWNYSWSNNCTIGNYTWNWIFCNELVFWYSTWDSTIPITYDTYNAKNTCRQNQVDLWFYRSGWTTSDIKYIRMNKWFTPTSISENKVFFLQQDWNTESDKVLEGGIVVVLCTNDECQWGKEVAKRNVDSRTQTISTQKCAFYDDDNLIKCAKREN